MYLFNALERVSDGRAGAYAAEARVAIERLKVYATAAASIRSATGVPSQPASRFSQ